MIENRFVRARERATQNTEWMHTNRTTGEQVARVPHLALHLSLEPLAFEALHHPRGGVRAVRHAPAAVLFVRECVWERLM